jgi:hypothetical protein
MVDITINEWEVCGPILEYTVHNAHRHITVEIGTEAAQFPEMDYINWPFLAVQLPMGEPHHHHMIVLRPSSVEAAVPQQPVVKVLALEVSVRSGGRLGAARPLLLRCGRRHSGVRCGGVHLHPGHLLLHCLRERVINSNPGGYIKRTSTGGIKLILTSIF